MNPLRERLHLDRRRFLTSAAGGIGGVALLALLRESGALALPARRAAPLAKAKNCIFFFMEGGPSQFDLFSYKPKLNELNGQRPPEALLAGKRFAFVQKDTAVLLGTDPARTFAAHGQSGMMFSDLLPNLSRHADRICLLQTVFTTQFNHHPAQLMVQTGDNLEGHPSVGSWFLYGLGSENKNLPGYVVMNSSAYLSGGERLWQSGFLPTTYGGVLFQPSGNPILNLAAPPGISKSVERRGLDALARLNEIRRQKMMDPEIAARIENYELAFRMQMAGPELTDLSLESGQTLARYGIDRTDPFVPMASYRRPAAGSYGNFARHCLLARRMVERGVRFINVFSGSWDAHFLLNSEIGFFSQMVDQPIAALIDDLAERGLLDETLVVIASEFGRTPLGENRPTFDGVSGRDHHPEAFCVLMIGGGTKGGFTYGETDELGWTATRDPVDIADVHATMLSLFGIDHTALSFPSRGADQRLTPLTRAARVINDIIA
ncbi:MAG TPA: DUF1501 domain-containing protein [Polyangiaceae bacterium]|nr:DUF1501 domain-containing protein [Polyangiaceae bacterium]